MPNLYRIAGLRRTAAAALAALTIQGCGGVWSLNAPAAAPAPAPAPVASAPAAQPAMRAEPPAPAVTPTTRRAGRSQSADRGAPLPPPLLLSTPGLTPGAAPVPPTRGEAAPRAPISTVPTGNIVNPPAGFFLPRGVFDQPAQKAAAAAPAVPVAGVPAAPVATLPAAAPPAPPAVQAVQRAPALPPSEPRTVAPPVAAEKEVPPEVVLYISPATRDYFTAAGIDFRVNVNVWERFLRKYEIPFELANTLDGLTKSQSRVLLLPSSVALAEAEKRAVLDFRARGGAVLSTWLTGVRGENGEWQGFGFMEQALHTKVVGNNEKDENDNFMMPHGDNPVTHKLPAGQRVWLNRVKEWACLRLAGRNSAADLMDWSRTVVLDRPTSIITYDEQPQAGARASRAVVLGYSEVEWLSADPKAIEPIALDALGWLRHRPDAYLATWPFPYTSAFELMIDVTDPMDDIDAKFLKKVEDAIGRATYYVLAENAQKSVEMLKKLKAQGHELGFLADRYEGYKDQSYDDQVKRFDAMAKGLKDAGVEMPGDPGFHAPLDSYDKNTEKILKERGFGHFVAFMNATESRLPFVAADDSRPKDAKPIVVIPRTQIGPEDYLDEDPDNGLKIFAQALDIADAMGGVSIVRTPNQTLLTEAQVAQIFKQIKGKRNHMWTATGGQIADWWRERERIAVEFDHSGAAPRLTVTIKGDKPLQHRAAVLVNLPQSGGTLRLLADGRADRMPKVAAVDAWRAALQLEGFMPGTYRWQLQFERGAAK